MIDFSIDFFLRILTVGIFGGWWLYWKITERVADKEKPKTTNDYSKDRRNKSMRGAMNAAQLLLILQLLFDIKLFSFSNPMVWIQFLGFGLVVLGVIVAVSARKTLGTNWAHAAEYQVKKKQELVTTGVYSVIRHPIYACLILAYIGGQLVAQSYLVLLAVLFIAGAYYQARLEEKLLIGHFGNAYKTYMKHSRMFIPYLW